MIHPITALDTTEFKRKGCIHGKKEEENREGEGGERNVGVIGMACRQQGTASYYIIYYNVKRELLRGRG